MKTVVTLFEQSVSFHVYYSFKYEAGGPSALKILTSSASRQPPGPGRFLSGEAFAPPCLFSGPVLVRNHYYS